MTIDIIDYTDEQYAALTLEQLKEVRSAQKQKDKLTAKLEEDIQTKKDALVRQGIFNSSIFRLVKAELERAYEQEVALLRDGLIFYLKYSMQPDGSDWDAPYTIDFSLGYEARFNVVREYYQTTYPDAVELYDAFVLDQYAPRYLGEMYSPLKSYFRELARQASEA